MKKLLKTLMFIKTSLKIKKIRNYSCLLLYIYYLGFLFALRDDINIISKGSFL